MTDPVAATRERLKEIRSERSLLDAEEKRLNRALEFMTGAASPSGPRQTRRRPAATSSQNGVAVKSAAEAKSLILEALSNNAGEERFQHDLAREIGARAETVREATKELEKEGVLSRETRGSRTRLILRPMR